MDRKKLEEANRKFDKRKKQKEKNKKSSEKKKDHEGMEGKDLRKNLGCG